MPHILRLRSFLFLSSLAIIAAHPAPAGALTGCKARASTSAKTPGAVLV